MPFKHTFGVYTYHPKGLTYLWADSLAKRSNKLPQILNGYLLAKVLNIFEEDRIVR